MTEQAGSEQSVSPPVHAVIVAGQVFRSTRNRTGRTWTVGRRRHFGKVCLMPDGAFYTGGGVRTIWVEPERLLDHRYWERVQ